MKKLNVTPRMLSVAKENKGIGVIKMDPFDFLILTVQGSVSSWIDNEPALTLDEYNQFSAKGDTIIMPYLEIDLDTSKVRQHEGRHRATALLRDSPAADLDVAIFLRKNGYLSYYDEPYADDLNHPKRFLKVYHGVEDLPSKVTAQFSGSSVFLNRRTFTPFYKNTAVSKVLARLAYRYG